MRTAVSVAFLLSSAIALSLLMASGGGSGTVRGIPALTGAGSKVSGKDILHFETTGVSTRSVGGGHVLYVDGAHGSDSNDGRSEAKAFQTISRALSDSGPLAAGDAVRVKTGRYRERPKFQRSGTASARIVIGAYGDGPVVLDASTSVNGWILVSGQVYKAPVSFPVTAVVVDEVPLLPEFSVAALVAGRFFYDSAARQLYVWGPNGGNPAARDVGVIKDDVSEVGLFLDHASYVTVYGITVRFSGGHGIIVSGDYVRVEECRAIFNGKAGISWFAWGAVPATNGEIIKNEIYYNVMINWPRGRVKWGGWPPGASAQGTPNALFQGNISHRNGGEGILTYLPDGAGAVIRDNVVYDNWSVNIYVDNQANAVVENNFVYCHQPDSRDLYNNGDVLGADGVNFKRLRPVGIMTADESYKVTPPANLQNVTIVNNVIVNCRHGVQHYAAARGSGLKQVKVLHNTIVVPAIVLPGEPTTSGVSIPYNDGNNSGSVYRNNVVYASAPGTYLLYGGSAPSGERFPGLTLDHNVWFHSGKASWGWFRELRPFHWGPAGDRAWDYTHTAWCALTGAPHGAGDTYADPLLVDVSNLDDPFSKTPRQDSPAVDRGADAGVPLDFVRAPRPINGRPDAGAFELGGLASHGLPPRP